MPAADIFVLPSYAETFGLVYLESMACGCITIGSGNEGVDGIIKDGENGLFCDPHDINSIKEKLHLALTQSKTERDRMRQKAFETVSKFSIEKKAREYLNNIKQFIEI